ncbi:MAG: hypothetical protein ACYS5F_14785 [Planctomycetota bacterium]
MIINNIPKAKNAFFISMFTVALTLFSFPGVIDKSYYKNEMNEQQNHLLQLLEQRSKLASDLETLGAQSTRTREVFLKTQGAIEYLEAAGVTLPEPEVTEESVEEG